MVAAAIELSLIKKWRAAYKSKEPRQRWRGGTSSRDGVHVCIARAPFVRCRSCDRLAVV